MILSEYLTQIGDRIQDDAGKLSSDVLTSCLQQAIEEYSSLQPRTLVEDQTGDGTAFLALPEDWEDEFSRILIIAEIDSDGEPSLMTRFTLIREPEHLRIFLNYGYATSDTTYRIIYTARHAVDESGSTLPPVDDYALCDLAASYAALRLAAAYAQEENASLGTVTIERRSKCDEYRTLSKELRKSFENALHEGNFQAANRMATWQAPSQGKLFH